MSVTNDIRNSRVLDRLRYKLQTAKGAAEHKRKSENLYKEASADALSDLRELDGANGPGVRFEWEGKEYAGYVCQPEDALIWDAARLTEHLMKIGKYEVVSVTVIDPEKLESEIAAGNIKRDSLKKFQIASPRTSYLKFINPKPDSK